MATYTEGDAQRIIVLSSSDNGATWTPTLGSLALETTQAETAGSLSEISFWLQQLNAKSGYTDTAGRLRVALDSISGSLTLGTITTVSTLTNQGSVGGYAANDQLPTMMRIAANGLRANIAVS